MTYRVVQWGTGNVGHHALAGIIANPDLELTGVWVSGAKAGTDAGTLAGLDRSVGVAATNDVDALLADRPDCVVYCSMTDNRLPEAIEDLRMLLAAGVNVVACAPVFFQYPYGVLPDELLKPVQEAAAQGDSSLWVNGIDPGFANDLLPLALAGTCLRIDQLRCMEIVDYASYDNRAVMVDIMGFGKPLDETPMLLQPGVLSLAWGSVVRQLAAGIGATLDAVTETYERVPAPESFDIATGHIAEGTAAALRFEVRGMVGDRVVTVLEHVTRLRPDLCPDWPQPAHPEGSYRVELTGDPCYAMDLVTSSPRGDHNYATLLATAMRIVNAVPAVVSAPAGVLTALDLPLITAPATRS
ncbi:NAD(P)H-dependent amine dehydrogenase family protein [Nocardia xishanensis]|uniref:NAD(P)H-dependent amine dehydrogenase family protein n=1 Tax=Nocardia xishanensis TaxID=238964 RepID=UPI00083569F0|nr:diacylglycerol kinase [Nocardia xishanensis]